MNHDYTTGSIFKGLIRFSLPYLLSCFLQTFYGLADLYVTGQFNGAASISAVSIGSQVMHMITVIIVGLAMGSTVAISQAVGKKDLKTASRSIGNTIFLFMMVSILFTVILFLCTNLILALVSTPAEALEQTRIYLMICFAGIPFITAYNIISCIFRGMGDSRSPLYFIAIACVMNIALDFLFIGYFGIGAAGAALGTVLSQTSSVCFALFSIHKKKFGLSISKKDFKPNKDIMGNIIKIGIPVAFQDGFIQISFLFITAIANQRGVVAAASVGIVEKIIGFLFLVPSAMLSSISAIAAQNMGAGKHQRARKTLQYGITISVIYGIFIVIICQLFTSSILSMFSNESAVIDMGCQYLRSYIFDGIMVAFHFCFSGYFCAYGKSTLSFIQNFASIVLIRIPGAWLASTLFPDTLFPMGLAAPLGSLLSTIICIVVFLKEDWEG